MALATGATVTTLTDTSPSPTSAAVILGTGGTAVMQATGGPNNTSYVSLNKAYAEVTVPAKFGDTITVCAVVRVPSITSPWPADGSQPTPSHKALFSVTGGTVWSANTDATHSQGTYPSVFNELDSAPVGVERLRINGNEVGLGSTDIGQNWAIVTAVIRGLVGVTTLRIGRSASGYGTVELDVRSLDVWPGALTGPQMNFIHQPRALKAGITVGDASVVPRAAADMLSGTSVFNRKRVLDGSDVDSRRDWYYRAKTQFQLGQESSIAGGLVGFYPRGSAINTNKAQYSIPTGIVPADAPTERVWFAGWGDQAHPSGDSFVSGLGGAWVSAPVPALSRMGTGTNDLTSVAATPTTTSTLRYATPAGTAQATMSVGFPGAWTIGTTGLPWAFGGENFQATSSVRQTTTVTMTAGVSAGATSFISASGFPDWEGWAFGTTGTSWKSYYDTVHIASVVFRSATNDYLWTLAPSASGVAGFPSNHPAGEKVSADTGDYRWIFTSPLTVAHAAGTVATCTGLPPVVPAVGDTAIVCAGEYPYLWPTNTEWFCGSDVFVVTGTTRRLDSTRTWALDRPLTVAHTVGTIVGPTHQLEASGGDRHLGLLQPYSATAVGLKTVVGSVATQSALPATANVGDGYQTADEHVWVWSGSAFADGGLLRWRMWEFWGFRRSNVVRQPDGTTARYSAAYGGFCPDFYHWDGVFKHGWGSRACGNSMFTGLILISEWSRAAAAATATGDITQYRNAIPHAIGMGYCVTGSDSGAGALKGTANLLQIAPANRWDGYDVSSVRQGSEAAIDAVRMIMGARWAFRHTITDQQIIDKANAAVADGRDAADVKFRIAVGFALRDYGSTTIDSTTGTQACYVEDPRMVIAGLGFGGQTGSIPDEWRIGRAIQDLTNFFAGDALLPVIG